MATTGPTGEAPAADAAAALRAQVDAYLAQLDREETRPQALAALHSLGDRELVEAAAWSGRLAEEAERLATLAGGVDATGLASLLAALTPPVKGGGWLGGLLHKARLGRYLERVRAASGEVQAAVRPLQAARDRWQQSAVRLAVLQEQLQALHTALGQQLFMARLLVEGVATLYPSDPVRAVDEVVSGRIRLLQDQGRILEQGQASLEIARAGAQRWAEQAGVALTVLLSAWRVAHAVSRGRQTWPEHFPEELRRGQQALAVLRGGAN